MSVLSFRTEVAHLDQAAELAVLVQRALARVIRTAGQYAVELKPEDAKALRQNLDEIAAHAEATPQSPLAAHLDKVHGEVRGTLRAYRDLAKAELDRIRAESADIMESMQSFMVNLSTAEADHEQVLRDEFASLETKAESGDIALLRDAIKHTADVAIQSCNEIQRSSDIVIAQLQDEIRHLHQAVDKEQRAAMRDATTGVMNRAKLDSRIKDLILLNEPFCIFMIGIPTLALIGRNDPRIAVEFLHALVGRIESISSKGGELGMTGRWSEDTFAIIFNLPLSGAPITADALESALNSPYSIQIDGTTTDLHEQLPVHAVEHEKFGPESAFYLHLGQAAFSVTAR